MAKYDHVGGCPCGLYRECPPDCELYGGKTMASESEVNQGSIVSPLIVGGAVLGPPVQLPTMPPAIPGEVVKIHERLFEISDASKAEMAAGRATKDDWGKLRFDLIPPLPLADLAAIYTMGAAKYSDNNWLNGMSWRRVRAAIERHLNAFDSGEDLDPESGLPHVMHAAWGCFTLAQYMRTHKDWDDRVDWKTVRKKGDM